MPSVRPPNLSQSEKKVLEFGAILSLSHLCNKLPIIMKFAKICQWSHFSSNDSPSHVTECTLMYLANDVLMRTTVLNWGNTLLPCNV